MLQKFSRNEAHLLGLMKLSKTWFHTESMILQGTGDSSRYNLLFALSHSIYCSASSVFFLLFLLCSLLANNTLPYMAWVPLSH
jgi:hypothetical protein